MNFGNMKQTIVATAKKKLAIHKNLGKRSSLSIMQVAELLDIVSGNVEIEPIVPSKGAFFENAFSLN